MTKVEFEKIKSNPKLVKFEQFQSYSPEDKKEVLTILCDLLTPGEIAEMWGVTKQRVYYLRNYYKITIENNLSKTKPKRSSSNTKVVNLPSSNSNSKANINPNLLNELETMKKNIEAVFAAQNNKIASQQEQLQSLVQVIHGQPTIPARKEPIRMEGLSFRLNGEFTARQLSDKMLKLIQFIENENNKFEVKIQIDEKEEPIVLEQIEPVEQVEPEEPEPKEPMVDEEKEQLKKRVEKLEQQLFQLSFQNQDPDAEPSEDDKLKEAEEGYQALKSDIEGLHVPPSEYKKTDGIRRRKNLIEYQTYYICPECQTKGKTYITPNMIYVNCKDCGKRMRVRDAVKDQVLTPDEYGNYYIAGDFKRKDERMADKPLVDLWNIQ